MMQYWFKIFFVAGIFSININNSFSQDVYQESETKYLIKALRVDTNYIKTYRYDITSRLYSSQKYTTFNIPTNLTIPKNVHLISNNTFNLGIGATYRGFSLNLGFGPPVINGNSSERGKTDKLDLQMHMHTRGNVIDVSAQFYKGFYNRTSNAFMNQYESYDQLSLTLLGISYQHLFNSTKYSLRIGFHHDERQLKSAGSMLLGAQVLYGLAQNKYDWLIHPEAHYSTSNLSRYRFFNIGPVVGYGYNLIIKKYFFASVNANVGIHFSSAKENYNFSKSNFIEAFAVVPHATGRLALGYTNDIWAFVVSWTHIQNYSASTRLTEFYGNTIGNYRMNIIYRFPTSSKLKKALKPVHFILK